MRQKLLLLAAVFFGILAFFFTYQQINNEKAKIQASTVEIEVIVMKENLLDGEEITEAHLEKQKVRRSQDKAVSQEIPWSKRAQIIGRKASSTIPKGTILTWQSIEQISMETGKTGLSGRINKNGDGKPYAITLPVDVVSSLNGLVRPNNRVDVIGTFRRPDVKDVNLELVTMTLMQDVKVLACGSDMGNQGANARPSRGYGTITLEVTLEEAENLIFAQQKGRITLILRSHAYGATRKPSEIPVVDWNEFVNRRSTVSGRGSR